MNDSFWNDCDALVSEALQGHDDELEPPRTVKKVMNIVKQIQVRDKSKTSRNLDRFDSSTPLTGDCRSDARSEAKVKSWTGKKIQVGLRFFLCMAIKRLVSISCVFHPDLFDFVHQAVDDDDDVRGSLYHGMSGTKHIQDVRIFFCMFPNLFADACTKRTTASRNIQQGEKEEEEEESQIYKTSTSTTFESSSCPDDRTFLSTECDAPLSFETVLTWSTL